MWDLWKRNLIVTHEEKFSNGPKLEEHVSWSLVSTRLTSEIYTISTDRRTSSGGEPGTHTGDPGEITIIGKIQSLADKGSRS